MLEGKKANDNVQIRQLNKKKASPSRRFVRLLFSTLEPKTRKCDKSLNLVFTSYKFRILRIVLKQTHERKFLMNKSELTNKKA